MHPMIWGTHRRSIIWAIPLATAVGLVLASVTYMGLVPSPRIWGSNWNLVWIMSFGAVAGAAHGLSGLLGAFAALRLRSRRDPSPLNDITIGALIGAGTVWVMAILIVALIVGRAPGTLILVPVGMFCAGFTAVGAAILARSDLRRATSAAAR